MSKTRTIALKRISKDIQEITKNPVEGIGITQYENDFLKYIVNIKLMNGIYKGFCLQLLLTFSDSYPTKPPKILIFPGQNFTGSYHHHVFSDSGGFYKFCFDLLENDFMKTDEENTGWNPSYTISSLLIQVQNFLCDPDLHHEVEKYLIDKFFESMKTYSREFTDCDGNSIIHTWANPYPKMFFKEEEKKTNNAKIEDKKEKEEDKKEEEKKNEEKDDEEEKISNKMYETEEEILNELNEMQKKRDEGYKINKKKRQKLRKRLEELKKKEKEEEERKKEEEERKRLIEIKENLTCFMLKLNYIEDPEILLGYPIIQKNTGKGLKTKIELYPIPELLTYDGFIAQIGKKDEKLDFYFDISFKSANNEFYNYWIPIYIDKNHFEKNKETILNSFSIIKFGAMGLKEYDFKTDYIFEILPIILNKMIIGVFNKKTQLSEAFIRCYFQYILLLKKLTEVYKKEFDEYLNNILTNIKNNYNHIDKKIIPDIGNFMVLLLFSNFEISDELWKCLIDESSIRQMYWMFHGEESVEQVKNIISKSDSIDYYRYNKPYGEKITDIAKETKKGNLKISNIEMFKNYLKEENIYNDISSMILNDENIYNFKEFEKPEENAKKNEQNPFAKLGDVAKKTENEDILEKNFDEKINDYLKELSEETLLDIFKFLEDKLLYYKIAKLYPEDKIKELEKSEYDKGYAGSILKDIKEEKIRKELLQQFFNNQRGNKLLLISYLSRKKIQSPGFMEELEKNYGVLLNCSDFLKEIKTTLESINSYKELYTFINCDLIGDKSEYDYIIQKYEIAKKKRYIKTYYDEKHPKPERKKYFNKGKDLSKDNKDNKDNKDENNDKEEEDDDDNEEEWETVGSKKKNDNNNYNSYHNNNNYNNYYHNNNYHNYRGNNYQRGRGRGYRRGYGRYK